MEGIDRQLKGKGVLFSLHLFKAYDMVNLDYLQRVMKAMNIPEVFISRVLLLHDGAMTRLLLDFISGPIDLTFFCQEGGSHRDDTLPPLCGAFATLHGGGDQGSVISCSAGYRGTSS